MPEKILVANIHPDAFPSQLAEHLGLKEYGSHARIELVMDRNTGQCTGRGYVIVPPDKQGDILKQQGSFFMDQKLKIMRDKDAPGSMSPGWCAPGKRSIVHTGEVVDAKLRSQGRKVVCNRLKSFNPRVVLKKDPPVSENDAGFLGADIRPLYGTSFGYGIDSPNRQLEDIKEEIVSIDGSEGDEDSGISPMKGEQCLCCDSRGQDAGSNPNECDFLSVSSCHGDSDDPIEVSQDSVEFLCTINDKEQAPQQQQKRSFSSASRYKSPLLANFPAGVGGGGGDCNSHHFPPNQPHPRLPHHPPHQPPVVRQIPPRDAGHHHSSQNHHSNRGGHPTQPCLPYRYPLIDVGAILTHPKFRGDLDDVVQRARSVGVESIIATGLNISMSMHAAKLAQCYDGYIYGAVGVHPHESKWWEAASIQEIEKLARQPWCVGIGECGLDYNRNYSPREKQIEAFEKQVALACQLKKPLILHVRDAHEDFVGVLSRHYSMLPPVLIHCFTGLRHEALQYLGMGFYIGITGYVCKDRSSNGVRSLLMEDELPLDKLILQTDCPYMLPYLGQLSPFITSKITPESRSIMPHVREGRNEPCILPLLAEIVAAMMKKTANDVAVASRDNVTQLFSFFPVH